jgi:phosphatidylglycerophosphate synthase
MLDRLLLSLARPALSAAARALAGRNWTANQVTLVGFGFGMTAAGLIWAGSPGLAIVPLLIGRICDGIDGALARLQFQTGRGAFLDITLDFLFYAAIPLAFALHDPASNALAAAILLAAFIGTGTSFLAYAILAAKSGETSEVFPLKSFFYLGGLTEGSETILCFLAMCLWPDNFSLIAGIFAGLCTITIATRIRAGWLKF